MRVSERELAAIFDTSFSAIKLIDSDYNVVRVNAAMEAFSGLSSEESVGKKCYEISESQEWCHTEKCPLAQVKETKGRIFMESVLKKRDGTEITCIFSVTPLFDDSREVAGILEDFIDISERKQMEIKLRDSEEFNFSLLQNSLHQINVINSDTSIRYVNPAFEKAVYPTWI